MLDPLIVDPLITVPSSIVWLADGDPCEVGTSGVGRAERAPQPASNNPATVSADATVAARMPVRAVRRALRPGPWLTSAPSRAARGLR